MRYGRFFVGVAATAVVVAGCGNDSNVRTNGATSGGLSTGATLPVATDGSAGGSGNSPQVDACALLSDADVAAGFAVSDMKSPIVKVTRTPNVIAPDTSSCTFAWTAADDSSSNFTLYVYPSTVYEGLKAAGVAETVPEIPGAYVTADGYFIAAGRLTLSLTGVVSRPATGMLFQAAAGKSGG